VLIGTGEKKQGNDDKNDDGVPDGLFFDIDTTGNEFNDGKDQDDDNVLEVEDLGKDDFRFSTSETLYWTGDADDDGDIETLQVKWDDDDDGKLQGYVEYQDDKGKDKTTDVIKLEMKGDGTVSGEDGFYWKAETKGDGIFSDELATSFVTAETGNPNFLAVSGSGSSTVGLVLSSFEGSTAATVNISSTGASGVKQLAVGGGDLDEGDTLQIEFSDNVTAGGFGTKPSVTTELVNSFSFELVAVTNKGTGEFEVYYQDHNGDWQLDDTYDFSGGSDRTIEVSVTTGMMAIKIVGTDIDSNQGFKVSLDNSSLIESVGDLILDFGVSVLYNNGSEDITSNTAAIKVGIDQTGDSKVTIDGTAIDGIISGMRYETSSGFVGYTDANGALKYNLSDNVTFSVGSVVLGTVAASATMIDGKVFLQDIVGVGLENITDDYVEKLAIFLQTLDNDGDAYNGIVITDEMHALFSDDNFDLEAITKEELVQLLLDNGLTPVDEDEAIQHVKDMITEHAGVTEFEEDDNDSISLLGDDEGLDLAWSLSDPEEPVDGMYLSDESDQVSLEIGDLLGDGIPDSDLSQYISVASDGLNTVIEVNSAGIGNTEGGASMSYTLEGVDLTTDTNGNALDTDSMNELLRNLYNGANDTGLM
ncbi:MAG: type I secretion C-terminal target domain-containing protein, partial [Pseudomonadales bacterium]